MNKRELEAAKYLLEQTELDVTDTVRLVMELLEESSGSSIQKKEEVMRHCRKIIKMGSEAHKLSQKTVELEYAIQSLLESKKEMRERTQMEIRQICTRFANSAEGFEKEKVRNITTERCREAIEGAFTTLPTRKKARRILHALFEHAIANGWCSANPLAGIVLPPHKEKSISSLKIKQILSLLRTAEKPEHIMCAPALGMMIWAGIRPHEVERLKVKHIDFEDKVITIPAEHAKTGGARHVTMHPVLIHWLRKTMMYQYAEAPIVPPSWIVRWAQLRKDAGFDEWAPDVLRHTFASYHLKYFKDSQMLQMEMGHSTPELLRTRYLAMENVTSKAAHIFWNYDMPRRFRDSEQQNNRRQEAIPPAAEMTEADQNLNTP